MSAPSPYCPKCKGIGWLEAPYYGDAEPRVETQPCPDCRPVTEVSNAGCLLAIILGALVFAGLALVRP